MATAHAMRHHVTAAFGAGVDGFVAKPITPTRLLDAIREVTISPAAVNAGG
ncbi:MAG: hypothetical protein ABUL55_02000 [Pseudomonadota bacterium]